MELYSDWQSACGIDSVAGRSQGAVDPSAKENVLPDVGRLLEKNDCTSDSIHQRWQSWPLGGGRCRRSSVLPIAPDANSHDGLVIVVDLDIRSAIGPYINSRRAIIDEIAVGPSRQAYHNQIQRTCLNCCWAGESKVLPV